jgi:hypothetical protein
MKLSSNAPKLHKPTSQEVAIDIALKEAKVIPLSSLETEIKTLKRITMFIARVDTHQLISGLATPSQWTGFYSTDPVVRVWCSPGSLHPTINDVSYKPEKFCKLLQKLAPHIKTPLTLIEGRTKQMEKWPAHFYQQDNPIFQKFAPAANAPKPTKTFDPFEL